MDWSEDENWETLIDDKNTYDASKNNDISEIETFTIVDFINTDGISPSSQIAGKADVKAYSEPCQTSKMELSAKIVNSFQSFHLRCLTGF